MIMTCAEYVRAAFLAWNTLIIISTTVLLLTEWGKPNHQV